MNAAVLNRSRTPSLFTSPSAARSPSRKLGSPIPKKFASTLNVPPARPKTTTRGPPRSSGVTTHSALPSPSMSPAVTNPPNVKFASPNGSVGASRTEPSLPLTTAIAVFVPGPVIRTVSLTPSPSKSPAVARTSPENPGNGVTGPPSGWSVPAANGRAAPVADPEITRVGPAAPGAGDGVGGGGGDGGGSGSIVRL